MRDRLGQISLLRDLKKRPLKRRKTQKKEYQKYASGVNTKPDNLASAFFILRSGHVKISFENQNPKNVVIGQSEIKPIGENLNKDFSSFDDTEVDQTKINIDFKNHRKKIFKSKIKYFERSNSIYDVTRNNPAVQRSLPGIKKNEFIKASISQSVSKIDKASAILSSNYENYDSKDPFFDGHSLSIEEEFYFNNKNHYNSGNIKPFEEKDNIKNNTIVKTKDANNEYFKSNKIYASHGFVYKSKKPDSISFGGLKR